MFSNIVTRRQIRKSRSLMQVLLFGDEINEDNSQVILKCKNIRQTGLSKSFIIIVYN